MSVVYTLESDGDVLNYLFAKSTHQLKVQGGQVIMKKGQLFIVKNEQEELFDPVNNESQALKYIEAEGIELRPDKGLWKATRNHGYATGSNKLEAGIRMLCFIHLGSKCELPAEMRKSLEPV